MATSLELSEPVSSSASLIPTSSNIETRTITIGTRRSALALVQTDLVVDLLKKAWPQHEFKIQAISTMGDKNQVTALHQFNAKSLWTYELEGLLATGEVDFIVHCLKDIPTQLPASCALGAILPREDPRDTLVLSPRFPATTTLRQLPEGSIIGCSVRRSAQLARLYPHLRFQSVRGNIGTRLSKLDDPEGPYSAIILAAAGLLRMNLGHRIRSYLSSKDGDASPTVNNTGIAHTPASSTPTTTPTPVSSSSPSAGLDESSTTTNWGMLYAVGQGALALEMRLGDERIARLLAPLNCPRTSLECLAERSLLRTLEGGCSVPIGVEAEWHESSATNGDPSTNGDSGTNGASATHHTSPPTATTQSLPTTTTTNDPTTQPTHLTLRATVVSLDGSAASCATATAEITTPEAADEFGRTVAQLLVQNGADRILQGINLNRAIIEGQAGA